MCDVANAYTEFLSDVYNLRYAVRCCAEDNRAMSSLCASVNDTVGICYYDGKANAFDTIEVELSALLDKAESGR